MEYALDETYNVHLLRLSDYDSMAGKLYKGDQLPESRMFVELHTPNHILRAMILNSPEEAGIMVIDRFGNKYQIVAWFSFYLFKKTALLMIFSYFACHVVSLPNRFSAFYTIISLILSEFLPEKKQPVT